LITGKHAFGGSGIEAVQSMLRETAPPPSTVARSLPREWDTLMLQPDAARRYPMSRVAGRLREIRHPSSSRPWRWAAAALLLLTAAAAFVGLVSRSAKPGEIAAPQWLGERRPCPCS
jgi:hypothetical protein